MSRRNGTIQGSRSTRQSMTTSHDRKLRYRALLEDLTTIDDGSTNMECMERTANAVQEAQSLLAEGSIEERARHPGESYLDSRVLKATSDLAVRCSEAVSGNANVYDRHELAKHMRENPQFWSVEFPRAAPSAPFLFGAFSASAPAQRPRARRARRARLPNAALKAPENVDKLEKTEEGSEMVSRVNRFITKSYRNSGRPLSYFHVVLDPASFSRTVENVYHVSFLVKDGLVSVQLDEEHGLPFITPVDQTQRERHNLSDENQFIVSIDMQRWQDMIEAFRIKEPMMVIKR
ncbi:non-structural maintenance of chromosomes element 4 homolog A isoform X2 [Plodia interpunctella]|uniref:non-structural maintenance of chromosomes element 4 homolog A isoform X2 n=1 Tax=Plodia interpunctella TaxID=58824 RepID=UPI0023684311|nr:non-structural maintenance of chromosomes element 4 homolog A isoform X2 [Plodia interpunctella]